MQTICTPSRKEYPIIVQLIKKAEAKFADIYSPEEAGSIDVATETVDDLLEGETSRAYLVLKIDGVIAAFASFRWVNSKNVWLSSLFVDPACQRQGCGETLISEVEKEAAMKGAVTVALETHPKADWAVQFYLKQGYRVLNKEDLTRPPFDQAMDKEFAPSRVLLGKQLKSK